MEVTMRVSEDCKLIVSDELKTLCMMAAIISTQGIEPKMAAATASQIMDAAIAQADDRLRQRIKDESLFRRGRV